MKYVLSGPFPCPLVSLIWESENRNQKEAQDQFSGGGGGRKGYYQSRFVLGAFRPSYPQLKETESEPLVEDIVPAWKNGIYIQSPCSKWEVMGLGWENRWGVKHPVLDISLFSGENSLKGGDLL